MATKTKEKTPKKPREKMGKKKIINTICILFLSIVLVGSVSAFAIVQSVLSSENLQGIDGLSSENSTRVFDRDGELITTLSSKSGVRENVKYEQIPQVVIDAFLSIEDSRFYKHNGFDFPRFIKSGYENLKAGGIAQGGSTLTMQLVDTALWSDEDKISFGVEDKFKQKIQEIFKSMEIESKISKEKIIENYLNKINFGGPARGIQKGAKFYFGKDVSQVTLGEAAFLAGVINAPGAYNPYLGLDGLGVDHYQKALQRRNQVLNLMVQHGYLTSSEASLAKSETLAYSLNGATNFETEKNKAYIDVAIREVRKKTGDDPYTTPMNIYTNMSKAAQEKADALCDGEGIDWPDELFQTGFAATNSQTGEVMALGGGRGYNGQKDRATLDTHQIGSTSKPLVDYAPAFEYLGYSTEHTILDAPVNDYTSDGQTLQNADRTFRGNVSLKTAIGLSLNVPAYKTMKAVVEKIGVSKWVEQLGKLGIKVDEDRFSYSMSIGGGDLVATPLELASSYSAFANKGQVIEPYTVKKVEYQGNKADYTASQEAESVYSEETAYLMSYMLKDAVDNSSYQTLVNTLKSSYPVYGKSGTSDYDEATAAQYGIPAFAARDKWMVGYSSTYTVGCWAGYDEPIAGQNTWLNEKKLWANIEGTIVKTMLDTLENGKAAEAIVQPAGVVSISFIKGLFPYASATDATDPSMLVTGLINKKFAKLSSSVEPDALATLTSLDISLTGNNLSINFAPYPDGSKTQGSDANSTFDKKQLFGPVQYKYEIYVNKTLVKSGASGSNVINEVISATNGDDVRVVGWYGYQSASARSNTLESSVKSQVPVPEEKVSHTVTYVTNGGTAVTPSIVNDKETLALPAPPTKEGALFMGWFIDAAMSIPFAPSTPITANTTLYAKWQ